MASLVQFNSRGCLSLKKKYYEYPAVRFSGNKRCSSNSFTYKKNHVWGFYGLSIEGMKGMGIAANRRGDGSRTRCYDNGSPGILSQPRRPRSPSELIKDFHDCLNAGERHKLSQFLTDNCQYEALLFYQPFNGKQEVLDFLQNVLEAIGHNGRVETESINEGGTFTASVVWHIAWKGKKIPFTTGCSFFEFEQKDGELLIRKITAVEEFMLKPGDLVLKLMKATTTLFDRFPAVAEGFLQNFSETHDAVHMFLDLLGGGHHRLS